jgi:hypothetical protein
MAATACAASYLRSTHDVLQTISVQEQSQHLAHNDVPVHAAVAPLLTSSWLCQVELIAVGAYLLAEAASSKAIQTTFRDSSKVHAIAAVAITTESTVCQLICICIVIVCNMLLLH